MAFSFDRQQKRAVLLAALNGDLEPLKVLNAELGERYTDEEVEKQRQYLSTLSGREVSAEDSVNFFGRYNREHAVGQTSYMLPNGMHLFF